MNENSVTITRATIVSFYKNFNTRPDIIQGLEDLFESTCKQLQTMLTLEQHGNNTNYILKYLENLDSNFKQNVDTMANTVSDKISRDISQQFYSLLKSIESCVSELNIDKITLSIKQIICDSSKTTLEQLDTNIKLNVIQPLNENHYKLLDQLNKLLEHKQDSNAVDSKLNTISDTWNSKIDNLLLNIKLLEDKVDESSSSSNIKHIFSDLLRDIEKQTFSINTTISHIRDDLRSNTSDISNIKSDSSEIKLKIYSMDKQLTVEHTKSNHNSNNKGSIAEHKIQTLLMNHLPPDHGYNVIKTGHLPHSCDFLVTCDKQPDIRLECKDYSNYVPHTEVDKFISDLHSCNNHGIFISLYSNIANKHVFDFEQLPNGKFAIYLSNNQYNIKIIIRMLRILYKLDSIVSTKNNSNITISPENIILIQQQIHTFNDTISSIQSNLKHTIDLVDTLTLNNIQQILLNQLPDIQTLPPKPIKTTLTCDSCSLVVKNMAGLAAHKRKCNRVLPPKTIDTLSQTPP
jgi:hypothetical protein